MQANDVKLTLNDFLEALNESTGGGGDSGTTTPPTLAPDEGPEIAQHLKRIGELTTQLCDEIIALKALTSKGAG